MSLYFFVAYINNMIEWDAAAKYLNYNSFTPVSTSVLRISASQLVTLIPLNSVKRKCF